MKGCSNAQQMGSAISYYRRYAWLSILGLATQDDDANIDEPEPSGHVYTIPVPTTPTTQAATLYVDPEVLEMQKNQPFEWLMNASTIDELKDIFINNLTKQQRIDFEHVKDDRLKQLKGAK